MTKDHAAKIVRFYTDRAQAHYARNKGAHGYSSARVVAQATARAEAQAHRDVYEVFGVTLNEALEVTLADLVNA